MDQYSSVYLVDESGELFGRFSLDKALDKAAESNLDLVKVGNRGNIPVCKIMDYGKYMYDKSKQDKKTRKKNKSISYKEIRLSYRIHEHDLQSKLNNIVNMLDKGKFVRVKMLFRGREVVHIDLGDETMNGLMESIRKAVDYELDIKKTKDNNTIILTIVRV